MGHSSQVLTCSQAFAAEYEFQHVTSSPRYPRSNTEVEHTIQTIKNLLKKAADPYRVLLAYRSTRLSNGFSPAQLLMGRRLRTTVLAFQPCWNLRFQTCGRSSTKKRRGDGQTRATTTADTARNLPDLALGDPVWITDTKDHMTHPDHTWSVDHKAPCAYASSTKTFEHAAGPDLQDTPKDTDSGSPGRLQRAPQPATTRSGRPVIKPGRLDL